jgi:hypothetical protein
MNEIYSPNIMAHEIVRHEKYGVLPRQFDTPDGKIFATVTEEYKGLQGQDRVALVDLVGRVRHYDVEQVS